MDTFDGFHSVGRPCVGVFYTAAGVVPISLPAFPMFNPIWIGLLFVLWKPASSDELKVKRA